MSGGWLPEGPWTPADACRLAAAVAVPIAAAVWLRRLSRRASNPRVLVGTLNVLGNAKNPIEFCPKNFNTAEWQRPSDAFRAALFAVTFKDVIDAAGKGHSDALKAWMARLKRRDCGPRNQNASVCDFVESGVVNVAMDNKILGDVGRVNPVILGLGTLAPSDGGGGEPRAAAAFAEAADVPRGSDRVIAAIVAFYAAALGDVPADSADGTERVAWPSRLARGLRGGGGEGAWPGSNPTVDQLLGLLAWDLACALAVRREPDAFARLCRGSYAVDAATGAPLPQNALLDRVIGHVVGTSDAHAGVPCVVGLQEPPPDLLSATSAPPPGFAVHYAGSGAPTPAFFYRHCRLVADVSRDEEHEFPLAWERHLAGSVAMAQQPDKIRSTIERLCICLFETEGGRRFAVLNFHVSSFKSEVETLGGFMGFAALHVQRALGVPAVCVADSNIDCEWGGETIDEQLRALSEAPLRRLPPELTPAVDRFGAGLRAANPDVTVCPPLGTITTMKRRTHFQAQFRKSGVFVASHKDFVLLPRGVRAVETEVGATGDVATNLDLLLPSSVWPADHFAVLTLCELE